MTSLLVRTVRTNPPLAVTGLVTVVVLLAAPPSSWRSRPWPPPEVWCSSPGAGPR